MKEFVTSAREAVADEDNEDLVIFKLDDQEVHAYAPTPGQLAMMYAAVSDHAKDDKRIAGVVDFFFGLIDEESQRVLSARLMDRNDPFELDQLTEIMGWLVEQWAARPTRSSSVSSPSPPPTGRKSTGRSRNGGSTHGATASIASAT